MMSNQCPEHARLQARTHAVLAKLVEITTAQFEAFKAGRRDEFTRLSEDLTNAVSAEASIVGELKEHVNEHGCQSP